MSLAQAKHGDIVKQILSPSPFLINDNALLSACIIISRFLGRFSSFFIHSFTGKPFFNPLYPVEIILPSLFRIQAPTLVCGSSLLEEAANAMRQPYSCQESLIGGYTRCSKAKSQVYLEFFLAFLYH